MRDFDFKRVLNLVVDWVVKRSRIIMPVVLLLCVALTVIIAINARERAENQKEEIAQAEYVPDEDIELPENIIIPELPLHLNKYPEVNELIYEFYEALAVGDSELAAKIQTDMGELEKIRIEEMAKFINYYETIDVYTKDGIAEDNYVVYVSYMMRVNEVDTLLPGMATYYVLPNDEGNLEIRKNLLENNVIEYIVAVTLQDNVVDLSNEITVKFNDLIANDKELEEYIAFMRAKITENVGILLAQNEQPDITADLLRSGLDDIDENIIEHPVVTSVMQARTTAVVNIRSSDSETADRLDRAIVGQEFTVLEQKGNGWSRIKYNNRDAYIKSEFLEIISEAGGTNETTAATAGTVRVTGSNVRVRSTSSTSGTVLGTVSTGDRFDLIEQLSNGWTRITYRNQTGYIRSDFLEID